MELTAKQTDPDKFPYWVWDDTTTPRVLFDKAVDKLSRTEPPCHNAHEKWCKSLYDLIDGTSFGPAFEYDVTRYPPNGPVPKHRYLACYAVEGDNEGHYVHVDLIRISDVITLEDRKVGLAKFEALPLMFFKTFAGLEVALEISNCLTRFFNYNS